MVSETVDLHWSPTQRRNSRHSGVPLEPKDHRYTTTWRSESRLHRIKHTYLV